MADEKQTDHEGRPITYWGGLEQTDETPLATPSCSAIEDIDDILRLLEDTIKGESGDMITEARGKLIKLKRICEIERRHGNAMEQVARRMFAYATEDYNDPVALLNRQKDKMESLLDFRDNEISKQND